MPEPVYNPTISTRSLFSASSPSFVTTCHFDDDHSKGMTQCIIVVWICISLIISDVEHSFTKLLVFMYPFRKMSFETFAHFQIELFVLLLLSCMSSSYVLDINS